eukprot:8074_1
MSCLIVLQLICLFLITCSNSDAPQIKLEKKGTEIIGPYGKKQTIASVGKKPDFMSISIDPTTGKSYKLYPIHRSQQIDIDTGERMFDHVTNTMMIVKDVYFSARPGGEIWVEKVPHVEKDPHSKPPNQLLNVGKVTGRRIPYQQMNVMLETLWDNNVPMWVHHLTKAAEEKEEPAQEVEIKPKYKSTVKFGKEKVELKEVSVDWVNKDFEIKKGDSCDFMVASSGGYIENDGGPYIFKEIKKVNKEMEAVFTGKQWKIDIGYSLAKLTEWIYDGGGIKVNGKWVRKWVSCYTRVRFDATPLIHIRFVTLDGIEHDSIEISASDKVVFKNLGTTKHKLTQITGNIGAGTAIAHFLEIDMDDEVKKYNEKRFLELLFQGNIKVNKKVLRPDDEMIPKSENAARSAHFGYYGDMYYEYDESSEFVESDGIGGQNNRYYGKEYVYSNVGYGWLNMLLVVFSVCMLICIMAFSGICGCFIGGYFTKYVMNQDKNKIYS